MPDIRETICITCGQALGEVPRLHRLSDGSPCPACRDRLLETLPPALPRAADRGEPAETVDEPEATTGDELGAPERASGAD